MVAQENKSCAKAAVQTSWRVFQVRGMQGVLGQGQEQGVPVRGPRGMQFAEQIGKSGGLLQRLFGLRSGVER